MFPSFVPPGEPRSFARVALIACVTWCASFAAKDRVEAREGEALRTIKPLVSKFCVDCHGADHPEAGLDLEELSTSPDVAAQFRHWRKVAEKLAAGKMPPADSPQPSRTERTRLVSLVRGALDDAAERHALDPGEVTIRRLTSAEYAYTIRDLTGLVLDLEHDFLSDAVGGEGFTNVGGVQFMQDSTLERYLAAARRVADHAVIGSGPLTFYRDPGETGWELSAVDRIGRIYRQHGFRTAAGEGGEAFGLDRYARAFFVAWRFRHRRELGDVEVTLAALAQREKVDARFAEYIHALCTGPSHSSPTSEVVAAWKNLPVPRAAEGAQRRQVEREVRKQCVQIQELLFDWQSRLGQNPDAKEEPRVLSADEFRVARSQTLEMNINWPPGTATAHLTFSILPVDGRKDRRITVIWRNADIYFRDPNEVEPPPGPFRGVLAAGEVKRLAFGTHPRGGRVAATDFVTTEATDPTVAIAIPAGARSARLTVEAHLDVATGDDCVVRCLIRQREETDQGKSVSVLLANPDNVQFKTWKSGVLEFSRRLPQVSHREPAPSDRDPIPPPFDSSYNNPERNLFHARIKYHRDDAFLVENILDDATRRRLDRAWMDLLGSCDYHDASLRFVSAKYRLGWSDRSIAELDDATIDRLPAEPRRYVRRLFDEYRAIQAAFAAAEPRHLSDVLRFAQRAWRRPLDEAEAQRLRAFYKQLRSEQKLDHRRAIRATLTRVLMAPAFLYRAEASPAASDGDRSPSEQVRAVLLSSNEVASRLSYFLWSSLPDEELRRAAAANALTTADQVAGQARRMLADAKSQRLSAEFFGQWLGFYRFDRFRGVDPQRFPEFTEEVRVAMHEEAVSFFTHVIRRDRPVGEILFADYGFLNRTLAAHYGIDGVDGPALERVDRLDRHHRGGLFGLGAVLTATSAPRRTSPVKRGDWILRRVLGTPVPPPPADAGSLPPDEKFDSRLTMKQRLAAHQKLASCRHCHARIDPLGFTLERFDAVGRWRETYRDGKAIDPGGKLHDGTEISGMAGLRGYLAQHESQFHRNLCTKLAGYALGRSESIADAKLIDGMTAALADDPRFSTLVDRIVRSRQFRYRRADAEPGED